MTRDEIQKVRDALAYYGHSSVSRRATTDALRILDAELAKPEQEPMYFGLTHDHTWLSVTPSCYKKLKPDMRMKVYASPVSREWRGLTEEDVTDIYKNTPSKYAEADSEAAESSWNRFNKAISDGPDSPYPEMASRFETHYGQSWTDKDWRTETSVWAAAWKAALAKNANAAPQDPRQASLDDKRDAERYRFMQGNESIKFWDGLGALHPSEWDEFIDAAMKEKP